MYFKISLQTLVETSKWVYRTQKRRQIRKKNDFFFSFLNDQTISFQTTILLKKHSKYSTFLQHKAHQSRSIQESMITWYLNN